MRSEEQPVREGAAGRAHQVLHDCVHAHARNPHSAKHCATALSTFSSPPTSVLTTLSARVTDVFGQPSVQSRHFGLKSWRASPLCSCEPVLAGCGMRVAYAVRGRGRAPRATNKTRPL